MSVYHVLSRLLAIVAAAGVFLVWMPEGQAKQGPGFRQVKTATAARKAQASRSRRAKRQTTRRVRRKAGQRRRVTDRRRRMGIVRQRRAAKTHKTEKPRYRRHRLVQRKVQVRRKNLRRNIRKARRRKNLMAAVKPSGPQPATRRQAKSPPRAPMAAAPARRQGTGQEPPIRAERPAAEYAARIPLRVEEKIQAADMLLLPPATAEAGGYW